jgi:D-alanyl-D-alanine carboxypeptidase (penicillin-binding protein 5/6)
VQGARRRLAAASVLTVVAAVALPGLADAADGQPKDLPAAAWVLIDATDGEVLAAHRAQEERSIASTTKLMTAYASRRDLRLGQTVTAPAYAAGPAESLMGLEAGEQIKVRDLLYGLLLVSGNDAAETLAQSAGGSEDAFVREMNRDAGKLGLSHTSYANPIGLDEPGNYSSASDLASLAIELRKDALFR